MASHIRDVRQLAQEASVENDPKKLMLLIHDLNEALALLRRTRKKSVNAEECPPGQGGNGKSSHERHQARI